MRRRYDALAHERDEIVAKRDEALKQLADEQGRSHSLEDQIGRLDLERSPAFREKYDVPIIAIRNELAGQFVHAGVPQDRAVKLADQVVQTQSPDDVPAVVSELPTAVQGMAMYKHAEVNRLFEERERELNDWRATQEGLSEVGARESVEVSARQRNELCDTGIDRLSRAVRFWDDPAFVSYRDAQASKVKAWFAQAPRDQIAAAAVEGALVAPFAYDQIEKLQREVADLRGRYESRMRLSAPGVAPYYAPVAPPAPPPPPPPQMQPEDMDDPVRAAQRLVMGTLLPGR